MATSYSDWVYYGSSCCALRIKWTYTNSDTTCKVAATLQRWDKYAQSGQGSVTLSQTSNGSSTVNFGSCSDDQTRDVVTLSTYTYSKGTSAKTVTASVSTNDWFATITDAGYVTIGKVSFSKTFSISKKTSYTVKYAANGGSSTPSSQTKWHGTALTLAAAISRSSSSPGNYTVTLNHNYSGSTNGTLTSKRTTSYTFSKWKATSGTQYSAKGSYTANAATTMTAQWTSSETRAAVKLTTPTRSGYVFDGWATSSTGAKSQNGGASYTPTGNTTFYARWNRTVTYNANGGSGAPSAQTALATSAITLSSTVPTRAGYRFLGWNTASGGTGTAYAPGASYAAQKPSVTLYAQWQVLLDIHDITVARCDSSGDPDPMGGCLSVSWKWGDSSSTLSATGFDVSATGGSSTVSGTSTASGTGGSASLVIGNGAVSGSGAVLPNVAYTVTVTGHATVDGADVTTSKQAQSPSLYTAPVISSLTTNRVSPSEGGGYTLDDTGEVLEVSVSWRVCESSNQAVRMVLRAVRDDGQEMVSGEYLVGSASAGATGTYGGTVVSDISSAAFDVGHQYDVSVTLSDVIGSTDRSDALSIAYFPLDVLGDGRYYQPTSDATVDQSKEYYAMDPDTGWYSKVASPVDSGISAYFEKTGPRPGHGVSFGAPAYREGFNVSMPAYFYDKLLLDAAGRLVDSLRRVTDGAEVGATRSATLWNDLIKSTGGDGDFEGADVHLRDVFAADGKYGAQLEVTRNDTAAGTKHNGIVLYVDNNGDRTVSVADATAWRNALGASNGVWTAAMIPGLDASKITGGTLPQSRGGTGASDLYKTLSATGAWGGNLAAGGTKNVTVTFSVPSGYSIAAIRRVSSGRAAAAVSGFYISGSTVVVAINNPTSGSLSSTNVTVDVLCLPSS